MGGDVILENDSSFACNLHTAFFRNTFDFLHFSLLIAFIFLHAE